MGKAVWTKTADGNLRHKDGAHTVSRSGRPYGKGLHQEWWAVRSAGDKHVAQIRPTKRLAKKRALVLPPIDVLLAARDKHAPTNPPITIY